MIDRSLWRPQLIVAAWASVLQFVVLRPVLGPFIFADELGYVAAARYFGPGYPDVQMQSGFFHFGYGLLLSPLTAIFGEPDSFHRAATTFNGALMVAGAVLVVHLIVVVLGHSRTAGLIGGLTFAAAPPVLVNTGMLWAESALSFWVVLSVWLVARFARSPTMATGIPLAIVAAFAYAIHPRALALFVASAVVLILIGYRSRQARPAVAVALVVLFIGFISVRLVNDLVADRLYADQALASFDGSIIGRFRTFILEEPTKWLLGLVGVAWYQVFASAGLVVVAWVAWVRTGWRALLRTEAVTDRHAISVFLVAALGSGWAMAATIAAGDELRLDQPIYGRYLDHLAPLAMAVAVAVLADGARRWNRELLGAAAVLPLIGGFLLAWHGTDFFAGGRAFVAMNVPVFATFIRVAETASPLSAGLIAGAAVAAFVGALRFHRVAALGVAIVAFAGLGVFTVQREVHPHSRNTVNLRTLAVRSEELATGGRVLLAPPYEFQTLFSTQFWADDVQFVLGTECSSAPYDLVIAAPDDPRYLDHAILGRDQRLEREILQPSTSRPVVDVATEVRVTGWPASVEPGQTEVVTISVSNTGSSPIVLSGGGNPRDLGISIRFVGDTGELPRIPVPVPEPLVEPGETIVVEFSLAAASGGKPLDPGGYEMAADVFLAQIGWLNAPGCDRFDVPSTSFSVVDR